MRGSLVTISVLGLVLLRAYLIGTDVRFPHSLAVLAASALLLAMMLVALSSRSALFGRSVAWLADRLIVFLYVLIPISIVSLVTVLVRNAA